MSYLRDLDDRHGSLKYVAAVIVVAIGSAIVLSIYISSRTHIDPGAIQTAQQHCVAWVQKYEPTDKNPVGTCQAAQTNNLKAFTYRWSKGIGPT